LLSSVVRSFHVVGSLAEVLNEVLSGFAAGCEAWLAPPLTLMPDAI
jgi:hypothetical protein